MEFYQVNFQTWISWKIRRFKKSHGIKVMENKNCRCKVMESYGKYEKYRSDATLWKVG